MSDDPFLKEYYALLDIINGYDKNLLTVKGWAVTLSLAALGFGFQYQHYGFFLIACVSGIAFWSIEGAMKRYQMRYYVRMREIEVLRAGSSEASSSPQIDWSWTIAPGYLEGTRHGAPPSPERYQGKYFYRFPFSWLAMHVALPHVISVIVGGALFLLGAYGRLGNMPL